MALKEYKHKRQFTKTREPKPKLAKTGQHRFVVQKHQATHLHYDFRLEMNGVLKSWAVPKGIPARAGIKRLAVQVEDHPVAYITFHGTIPKGEYGGGKVDIWDHGTYRMLEHTPASYKFELFGKKLKGIYVLYNFKETPRLRSGRFGLSLRPDRNWFFFKTKVP